MKFSMKYVFAVLAAVLAVLGARNMAFAEDELYLCGIVKDVDVGKGIITVDIKSESCRGERQFKVPQSLLMGFIPKKEKCFSIDSNTCAKVKTYNIISSD